MEDHKQINLQNFYPSDLLKIVDITDHSDSILIHLKSCTNSCKCPNCGKTSYTYHGTYVRKVQDLPIFGKKVMLEVSSHEYNCDNQDCLVSTIAETFEHFILPYSRMTERLFEFLCSLALETSCEGAARIAKAMHIKVSGDTIVRLLLKKYHSLDSQKCGDVIGIDDFAFRKGQHYGTIVVDEKSYKTMELLEGRDGTSLAQWLKQNQHIKAVTRDRASAYAKVLEEELPGIMQIADRFHLYQNLFQAVQKAIYREVDPKVEISRKILVEQKNKVAGHCKKNPSDCA